MNAKIFSPEVLLTSEPIFPLVFPPVRPDRDNYREAPREQTVSDYRLLEHLRGLPCEKKRGRPPRNPRRIPPLSISSLTAVLGVPEDKLRKANVILYYGNVEILESIREGLFGVEAAYREVSIQFLVALPPRLES